MTRRNENRPLIRHPSPLEIELMGQLADDLATGGVDVFLSHEQEWRGTPLYSFMQGQVPEPEEPSLDPVAIYDRWNNKAAPPSGNLRRAITDLDTKAIYAKWNGSARQQVSA